MLTAPENTAPDHKSAKAARPERTAAETTRAGVRDSAHGNADVPPPYRPLGVRCVNFFGQKLRDWGLSDYRCDPAKIIEKAKRHTKLDNWGSDEFLEPLEILCRSYEQDAGLTVFGRVLLRHRLTEIVENRLMIHHELTTHPEILGAPVRRPLFVLGLPRTGTTLLYNLLSQDPAARPLYTWETFWPVLREREKAKRTDPRLGRAKRMVRVVKHLAPQISQVHPFEAEAPEECTWLLANSLVSPIFALEGSVRTYADWLRTVEPERLRRVYEYYKQQLQILQHYAPAGHWVLKSPTHLSGVGALLDVFPDAAVVHTHRDPAKVVASSCSLFAVTRGMYSQVVDRKKIGPEMIQALNELMERTVEARAQRPPERVLDVHFKSLMQDPLGTVKRIYEHFGYAFDPQMEEGIARWLKENPRGKHGEHKYTLEEFGLTRADVDEQFGAYRAHFGIAAESGA